MMAYVNRGGGLHVPRAGQPGGGKRAESGLGEGLHMPICWASVNGCSGANGVHMGLCCGE
jgi:hypothetical protein